MIFSTLTLPAGDQTDALLLTFPAPTTSLVKIHSWWLSAAAPAFAWTLYLAAQAAEPDAQDVVILDSFAASDPTVTLTGVGGGVTVVNRSITCPGGYLVPLLVGTGTQLRVTTVGKGGVGTLRVAWEQVPDWMPP